MLSLGEGTLKFLQHCLFHQVNESERERTLSELEHRRTSQSYHRSEMRVQQLQKELKRAIAKSR